MHAANAAGSDHGFGRRRVRRLLRVRPALGYEPTETETADHRGGVKSNAATSPLPRGVMNLDHARRLRKNLTDAEQHLWQRLRRRQLGGHKFSRQAPIGQYIVDFVCFEEKL